MGRVARTFALLLLALLVAAFAAIYALGAGWLGTPERDGVAEGPTLPAAVVQSRGERQSAAARAAFGPAPAKQILFGDLHVHTTFSFDAYTMSLPVSLGDTGSHPPADACDFARYCSALDFWSINDHAEQLTPRLWSETVDSIRRCNALAGDPKNPDTVAFLGWEWTQTGPTPEAHFGHRNVVLRDVDDASVPARPIAAPGQGMPIPPVIVRGVLALAAGDQRTRDMMAYLRELDAAPPCEESPSEAACREIAHDPRQLLDKLDALAMESMVIPHGTTWGIYSPPGTDWRKQLVAHHDPKRQRLLEVFSGHGNSERWIDNQAFQVAPDGTRRCPEETPSYLPGCRQAGRIVERRCQGAGLPTEECARRAAEARQNHVDAGMAGHTTVPGVDMWTEWRDSGQCRDCFLPAFNYRRRGSAQYMLAMTDFSDPEGPRRLDFGFIAASDNHSARPGTGYKEFGLRTNTDARQLVRVISRLGRSSEEPLAESRRIRWQDVPDAKLTEPERFNSFWYTGGLVAVHSASRDRRAIWEALRRKEVYGTSGPRILLWFDRIEPGRAERASSAAVEAGGRVWPMGSHVVTASTPTFRVRAVASLEQQPGCPAQALRGLDAARLERLCQGECYHPSDRRRLVSRIEIVRIRPQAHAGEPIDPLIEDPWRVHHCPADPRGCEVVVADDEYAASGRSAIYYARAIEEPSEAMNGAQLGCEYDERGVCMRMRDCGNDAGPGEDCLAPVEHRAWSSPIFLDPPQPGATSAQRNALPIE
ncbi:MAG: DUF3604 domain-containing protein [Myxococcota bacterium]|nr:DUF3604 domain-containing protein [Myxococcota bacterium]